MAHVVSFREATTWMAASVTLALVFNLGLWRYAVPLFAGVRMVLVHMAWKIDTLVSLGVIVLVLAAAVVFSLLWPKRWRRLFLSRCP